MSFQSNPINADVKQSFYMISPLRIQSSSSLRFADFREPIYRSNGQSGCFNIESVLLIPMLLCSAASFIVNVNFRCKGTRTLSFMSKHNLFSALSIVEPDNVNNAEFKAAQ